jgi:Cysteine-rich CWC
MKQPSCGEQRSDVQTGAIREKQCPACGKRFACQAGGCWCGAVALGDNARARLAQLYADCLCPACLRQAAASG